MTRAQAGYSVFFSPDIPPELWRDIWLLVCNDPKHPGAKQILSRVCRVWRARVLAIPHFWISCTITIPKHNNDSAAKTECELKELRAFLDRSSPLEFELAINLRTALLDNYTENVVDLTYFLVKLSEEDAQRVRLVGAKTAYPVALPFVLNTLSNLSLGKTLQLTTSDSYCHPSRYALWEKLHGHMHGVQNLVLPKFVCWTAETLGRMI